MQFCYSNNGLNLRTVSDNYTAQSGEWCSPSTLQVTPAQLAIVFPLYQQLAVVPPPYQAIIDLQFQRQHILDCLTKGDTTYRRIGEAVVLGLSNWTNPDVIVWMQYQRELRALLLATEATILPVQPPYPAGT